MPMIHRDSDSFIQTHQVIGTPYIYTPALANYFRRKGEIENYQWPSIKAFAPPEARIYRLWTDYV